MSGLHRTVSNVRKAITRWIESDGQDVTVLKSMAAKGYIFETALRAFSDEEQDRVRRALEN